MTDRSHAASLQADVRATDFRDSFPPLT